VGSSAKKKKLLGHDIFRNGTAIGRAGFVRARSSHCGENQNYGKDSYAFFHFVMFLMFAILFTYNAKIKISVYTNSKKK
jgi:hypothetical protein